MEYEVNGLKLRYLAEGKTIRGEEKILLDEADDLTSKTSWKHLGFDVGPLFDEDTYAKFKKNVKDLLLAKWKTSGISLPAEFNITQYHRIADAWETHLRLLAHTKLLTVDEFPLDVSLIERRISEICDIPLIARNPFDHQSIFHFRIVRPMSRDNNPLHRDVWLEDYDNCINIYIPVAGSNERSSLIIIPGSHRWPESAIDKTEGGAFINGVRFNVPAVTAIHRAFEVVRPNPAENEVLVFSPYLIHGGAVNLNESETRISIEMRFWRKT